ncbi:MAG: site-specific integrase [Proteobacteria bacterium]|nr:site-specific integrase [Pseudomonadota bacterium]
MASIRKRTWRTAKGESRTAWSVDFIDSSGTRQRRQFSTRREADDCRADIESQLRAGTFRPDADKVTVKEVAQVYIDHVTARSKRGERFTQHHLAVVEGHIWNYIAPDAGRQEKRKAKSRVISFTDGIGAVKLSQITARRVGDFRDRLRDAGVSVVTTRKILNSLHGVLEYAISRDLTAVNAAHGVKVIGRRDEGSKKIVPPAKEAMKALIDIADEDFRVKLIFAAATGVRAGELHALRWNHIDFDKGEVTIETRVDVYGDEDVAKTAAGMRTVPLGSHIVVMLKAWKLRTKFKKPTDLIFPNRRGTYISHDNMVKRRFNPLFDKLAEKHKEDSSVPAVIRFNWHGLRHFAVSCWIEAGLAPKTVQTFAGHSSLQVTMDRYGHLFKSDDHKRAMDAIAKGLIS